MPESSFFYSMLFSIPFVFKLYLQSHILLAESEALSSRTSVELQLDIAHQHYLDCVSYSDSHIV